MSSELVDIVVSRQALERTGYVSLEQAAQEAGETLGPAFVGPLKSDTRYEFRGTTAEYQQFMLGASSLASAYHRTSMPAERDQERVFRALCFGRNFVTLLRQYQPVEYGPTTPLAFDSQIDSQAISHALSYAKRRDILTYYANSVAMGKSVAIGRRPALYGAARAAVLYVFMQAEQQAYDAFIEFRVASLREELNTNKNAE